MNVVLAGTLSLMPCKYCMYMDPVSTPPKNYLTMNQQFLERCLEEGHGEKRSKNGRRQRQQCPRASTSVDCQPGKKLQSGRRRPRKLQSGDVDQVENCSLVDVDPEKCSLVDIDQVKNCSLVDVNRENCSLVDG